MGNKLNYRSGAASAGKAILPPATNHNFKQLKLKKMTITKVTVNGIEFEINEYNTIKNFKTIEDIDLEFSEPIEFENNDGSQVLIGEIYEFKSDSEFDCIFLDRENEELSLQIMDIQNGLNELL